MAKSEDIVDLVLQKIDAGELKPGDRLPTHRDMAWDAKCSVGTVTRAYAELERRGITYGQVGRGTYVFGTGHDKQHVGRGMFLPSESPTKTEPDFPVDLTLNRFYHPDLEKSYKDAFARLSAAETEVDYQGYFDCRGRSEDLKFAAKWLKHLIGEVDEENILITLGAQSALYLAMSALTSAGDSIATEAFGYPGIKAAAQELGLRLTAIEMDDQGLMPEAFKAAAMRGKIKLLITVPTNHNPTGTTLSLERRLEIVQIAREHNILIVEDGVYGPFQSRQLPTFREISPDISLYLTSLSKVFSPGLRVGYLVAPGRLIPKLANRMTVINWMTSPITLDVTNYLLDTGVLAQHQSDLKEECERRYVFARETLKPWLAKAQQIAGSPLSHLWLKLPASVTLSDFVARMRKAGILLIGGDRFAMNRQQDDHYVRICLMGVPEFEQLKWALQTVGAELSEEHAQLLIS